MKSQNDRVLAHLRIAPITCLQAIHYMGCTRLGARIWELRQAGHKIGDRCKMVHNRRGEQCRVKEYWLVREKR